MFAFRKWLEVSCGFSLNQWKAVCWAVFVIGILASLFCAFQVITIMLAAKEGGVEYSKAWSVAGYFLGALAAWWVKDDAYYEAKHGF